MNLHRLRVFVAVAEHEHVTRAAGAQNLTQSAVSNGLAALEREHGVRLFDRIGRGLALNMAGRAFLPEAKAVLARAEAAASVLADLSGLKRGRLAIFASQTIASAWLPQRLVAFHLAHPGIELDVRIGNSREVCEAVGAGVAEIGLVEGRVDDPMLDLMQVGTDRLTVLVRPDHPWTRSVRLSAEDLLAGPWVLREPGSGTRSTLEGALRDSGVDPRRLNIALVLPTNEMVLAATEAGAGATALSESLARAPLAAGRLTTAPFVVSERAFLLVRHKDRYRSRAGDAFAGACEHGEPVGAA